MTKINIKQARQSTQVKDTTIGTFLSNLSSSLAAFLGSVALRAFTCNHRAYKEEESGAALCY